jgi:hypothetical protein
MSVRDQERRAQEALRRAGLVRELSGRVVAEVRCVGRAGPLQPLQPDRCLNR